MGLFENVLGKKEPNEIDERQKERDLLRENTLMDVANRDDDYQVQQQRSDLLKWQQNFEDELTHLKHRLRSEVQDDNGRWVPKLIPAGQDDDGQTLYQELPPLANELFIDYIETQVEPFLSRNLFSSNFDEKRILEMLRSTCDDIADAMADGWDIYGIQFINYDLIMRLIKNVIIPGPFRALNDGQRRHDRTIAKRVEAFQDGQQKPRKSFMGANLE